MAAAASGAGVDPRMHGSDAERVLSLVYMTGMLDDVKPDVKVTMCERGMSSMLRVLRGVSPWLARDVMRYCRFMRLSKAVVDGLKACSGSVWSVWDGMRDRGISVKVGERRGRRST